MGDALSRAARDTLVLRIHQLEEALYPGEGGTPLPQRERLRAREQLYATLGEYADRLPRMRLSVCPYCEEPLRRVFDPFGMDGPWWHADVQVTYEEPDACEHFRVLLGAVNLGGREPAEVGEEVRPGPEVPFVVPELLQVAGMRAVIGSLKLATGDVAYPIGYFANEPTDPLDLHQPWCRTMFWFTDDDGTGWSASNAEFDFQLAPWVQSGAVAWTDLADEEARVRTGPLAEFPFLDIPGERSLQQIVGGEREFIGLPTGQPLDPFES
jgi:hypothetical protein